MWPSPFRSAANAVGESADQEPAGPVFTSRGTVVAFSRIQHGAPRAGDEEAVGPATSITLARSRGHAGKMVKGRAEIEKYFAKGFAESKGLKIKHSHSSIRFIKPDVAIDNGTWEITGRPEGTASKGRYTALLIKHDGNWLIVCDRPMVPFQPPK